MKSSTAPSAAAGSAAAAAAAAAAGGAAAPSPDTMASGFDGCAQDVGNAVHLEHINLEVPDLDLARVFYSEGLGLTPDPDTLGSQRGGPFVAWYNIGRQQLHIIKGPAQNTRGAIVLKAPPAGSGSLERVAERLARLEPVLAGTQHRFAVHRSAPGQRTEAAAVGPASAGGGGGGGDGPITSIEASDPWGQRFVLVDCLPGFPFAAGIAEVQLPCFAGTAHLIARFYSQALGARVAENGGAGGGAGGGGGGGAEARVFLGPRSCLRFVEDPSLGEASAEAVELLWTGWHIAFYIASFSPAYQTILDLGLNLLDHPYRDKAHDLPAALACSQFRFKDVVVLDACGKRGQLLYCLGHEVRSLHHPGYLRPLYNRRDFEHA